MLPRETWLAAQVFEDVPLGVGDARYLCFLVGLCLCVILHSTWIEKAQFSNLDDYSRGILRLPARVTARAVRK